MQASDYIFLMDNFQIMVNDEPQVGSNLKQYRWETKKLLIIQDSILFFRTDVTDCSILSTEEFKLSLEKSTVRMVDVSNAQASNLNMTKIPSIQGNEQLLELIMHQEKARYMICCKNYQDAELLCRAINCASSWITYARYCQRVAGQKVNKKILEFFHDLIPNLNSNTCWKLNYFDLFTDQYNEECVKSVLEIIKKNTLIQAVEINFDINALEGVLIDDLIIGSILEILTSFPSYQLNELNIISCDLGLDFLRVIQPGISHNSSLTKINLSRNLLVDKSLELLSTVFPNTPYLTDIDLSYNNLHGKPPYLENFINEIQINLIDIKLNLSNNKIKEQCFDKTLFYADKIYIKELDISCNSFNTEQYWKLFMGYYKCKNRSNLVIKMFPIFFHSTYLKEIFQRRSLMTITLERSCFLNERKNPPTTKENMESIKQLEKTIIDFFEQNCTVEQIYSLCSRIESLDYDFPSKKLDDLYDLIWDKLFVAKESHDHYSLKMLEMAALCIGLDVSPLKQQFKDSLERTQKLVKKMNQIINFEIREEDLNKELDSALKEAYELDIRGRFIDILTEIKEKRDECLARLINQNYQELIDEDQEEDKRDPFWFLDLDLEFLNLKPEEAYLSIDINLMLHPMKTNYFELCFLSHNKLEQDLKFSSERVEKEQSYFLLNAYNRALFLIADHAGQRGLHKGVWENSRGDIKLNCSRISIQYKNYEFRKELQSLLDVRPKKPYPLNYVVLNYSMPENPMGFQVDYDMSNYVFLRSVEEYFGKEDIGSGGDSSKQILKTTTGSDKKQGASTQKNVNVKKDILIYSKNPPSHTSLRTSRQEEFNLESQNLQRKINIIFQLYVDDSGTPENVIMKELRDFIKKLIHSRQEIEDKSDGTSDSSYIKPDTDELVDEAYLLLYKFTNRTTQDKVVNLEYVFRFLIIMTLFAPPSYDLEDHVRSWLLGRVNTKGIEQIVKKSLINLANHYRDDFAKCYWIPSVWEINQRMKGGGNFEIEFYLFDDSKRGFVLLNDFATVNDFMEEIYKHDLVRMYNDRSSFWVYKSPLESGEDVALYGEEVLFEKISTWEEGTYQLRVKRRIHNSFYTTSFTSLDEIHMESFFLEIKREFIQKDKFANFCKVESVVKLASILYILWSKEKFKDVSSKPDRIEKKLKSFLPSSWLSLMPPSQLSQRMVPILQTNLPILSIRKLKEEFLIHLRSYFLFTGNIYEAQMLEISGTSNIRMPILVLVNVFGIFFFNPKMKDKPIRTIFYEEIVYFLGYGNECILNYCEGDPSIQFKLNLMFKYPRGREINEDITSCSILRTKEKSKLLYALNNLPEFQQRFASTSSMNKKKTMAESARVDFGEDDEELERELEEIMMTVDKELGSNEFVFIIDKWFPFHEKCPLFIETEQLRKPPPRPKKGTKQSRNNEGSMSSSSEILASLRKPMTEEEREKAENDKTANLVNELLAKKGITIPVYDPKKGGDIPPPPIKKNPMDNAKLFLDSIKPPPKDGEKPISKMSSAEFLSKLKMKPPSEKNPSQQEKPNPDEKVPVFSTDKHTELKMSRPSQIERDSHEFGFNKQASIKKRERKYQDEKSNTESSSEEPKQTGKSSEEDLRPPPQIKSLASLLKKTDPTSQTNDNSLKEQQEREERAQKEKEERDMKEKKEREEKELRDRKDREEREKREKEEREKREREERERREKEERDRREKEEKDKREKDDRERREKQELEERNNREKERRERDEKERKEKEDLEKMKDENKLAQPNVKAEERRPSEQNRVNLNNSIFSALSKFPTKSNVVAAPPKIQNDVDKFYELEKEDNLNLDAKKLNPPLKPRSSRSSITVVGPKSEEGDRKAETSERKSIRKSIKVPEEVKRPSIVEKPVEQDETLMDKNVSKNLSVKKQLAMKRNASNQSLSGASVSGDSSEMLNEAEKSPEKKKEAQTSSMTKLPNFLSKKPVAVEPQPANVNEEKKDQPNLSESKTEIPAMVEEKPAEKSEPKSLSDKLKMRAKKNFK